MSFPISHPRRARDRSRRGMRTCRGGPRSAGPALRPCGSSSDAGSCRVANRVVRIIVGRALKNRGQATGYK